SVTVPKGLIDTRSGIFLGQGASGNVIGGTTPDARNLISIVANPVVAAGESAGVTIGSDGNLVEGNYIGTAATGMSVPSSPRFSFIFDITGQVLSFDTFTNDVGVFIAGGSHNTVGGTAAGASNLLSGNGSDGLAISAGTGNVVHGNLIGTNAAGTAALPNADD